MHLSEINTSADTEISYTDSTLLSKVRKQMREQYNIFRNTATHLWLLPLKIWIPYSNRICQTLWSTIILSLNMWCNVIVCYVSGKTITSNKLSVFFIKDAAGRPVGWRVSAKKGNFAQFCLIAFIPVAKTIPTHRDTINIKHPFKVNFRLICKCYNACCLLQRQHTVL